MKPTYRHLLTLALATLASTALSACDKPETQDPDDMGPPVDLAGKKNDFATNPDLTSPPVDMATPPDSAPVGPMLTGLPTCTVTGVTADALYNQVIMPSCASGRCHSTGAGGLTITSGMTLIMNSVNQAARQTTVIPRVKPGDINQSYLIYKLMNQQVDAGGSGDLMPKGGSKLADADLCKVIVWVKEGAK